MAETVGVTKRGYVPTWAGAALAFVASNLFWMGVMAWADAEAKARCPGSDCAVSSTVVLVDAFAIVLTVALLASVPWLLLRRKGHARAGLTGLLTAVFMVVLFLVGFNVIPNNESDWAFFVAALPALAFGPGLARWVATRGRP